MLFEVRRAAEAVADALRAELPHQPVYDVSYVAPVPAPLQAVTPPSPNGGVVDSTVWG
jgi:hypothetical protein